MPVKFTNKHPITAARIIAAAFYSLTAAGVFVLIVMDFMGSGNFSDVFKLSAFFTWFLFYVATVFLLNGGMVKWDKSNGIVEVSDRDETKTGKDVWAENKDN